MNSAVSTPKKIKAVFQGMDGSLGFRHNRIYDLIVTNINGEFLVKCDDGGVKGRTSNGHQPGACFYSSERTFLQNWMTPRMVWVEKTGNPTVRTF